MSAKNAYPQEEGRWSTGGGIFAAMPEELVLDAVRRGLLDAWSSEIRIALWRRMPDQVLGLVDVMVREQQTPDPRVPGHGGPVGDLVWSAPSMMQAQLVERAKEWVEDAPAYAGAGDWVWRWLIGLVDQRGPAWRDAYTLLQTHRDDMVRALRANYL